MARDAVALFGRFREQRHQTSNQAFHAKVLKGTPCPDCARIGSVGGIHGCFAHRIEQLVEHRTELTRARIVRGPAELTSRTAVGLGLSRSACERFELAQPHRVFPHQLLAKQSGLFRDAVFELTDS